MEMKNILNRMLNHEELTRDETKNIILGITQSEFPEEQITALLTGLQMRGVTVDELLGFRDGILETGVPAILLFLYWMGQASLLCTVRSKIPRKWRNKNLQY